MPGDKIYLPKQQVAPGRGVAGYYGDDIQVVDPETRKEQSSEDDAKANKAAVAAAKKAKDDGE